MCICTGMSSPMMLGRYHPHKLNVTERLVLILAFRDIHKSLHSMFLNYDNASDSPVALSTPELKLLGVGLEYLLFVNFLHMTLPRQPEYHPSVF